MARITYNQARADHEYLWAISPADDMTGAYVDQEDLATLLKSPTKATARDCYIRQIEHWFNYGPADPPAQGDSDYWIKADPRVREIAERYGVLDDTEGNDD